MSAILQGDLRFFPAAQLLPFLAAHEHTGTLVVSSGKRQARILFQQGRIAWLEEGQQVPVAEDFILDLLGWGEGTFAFEENAALPEGRSLALDVLALFKEGERRDRERRRILNLYPDDRVTFRVADPPDQISLTPAEFKLIFRIGLGETLGELCRNLGRPPVEVYPLLYNLEANGLIAVVPSAGGEATTISRRVPPSGSAAEIEQPARAPLPSPALQVQTQPLSPPPEAQAPPAAAGAPEDKGSGAAAASRSGASLREASSEQPLRSSPPAAGSSRSTIPEPEISTRTLVGTLSGQSESGGMHPLMSDELIVGRDASNAVNIQDGSVSTRHARITRTPEGFVLEDLKSRNGTFVNGEPVREKRLLADNDVIRFGRVLLTFNTAREIAAGERTVIGKIP